MNICELRMINITYVHIGTPPPGKRERFWKIKKNF